MTEEDATPDLLTRVQSLRAMHSGPSMLVLPNAWDAASARVFETCGFQAIATTSGGVAAALGFDDQEAAPVDQMLAAAARIIAAVNVPVTVDFEAGYRLAPTEIVEQLVSIGAAGLNLEDSNHDGRGGLVDAEKHAERVAALKAAVQREGVPLVVNARVDVFIRRLGTPEEQLTDGLRRARLYQQAGADCIYPITLTDEVMIAEFVEAVGAINLNMRPDGAISLARAAALGVRRVSYATSIFRESLARVEHLAQNILGEHLASS